ncbi:RNA polymerase sigma factor [Streptomyces sp. NPDC059479]|uniref:RNA polymerase sigma factor n=1 Tax=Streptomyces sp. NPDC059479 TaxID=3346848 RepID=UPI00368E83E6
MGDDRQKTPEGEISAVYREKRTDLLRHARRCLARAGLPESRLDADDLFHEAVVVTMANHAEKPIGNLAGYMYTVIANKVRDERRRVGTAEPVDMTLYSLDQASFVHISAVEEITPEDVADRVDLGNALRELPEQQRRMVTMAKALGYSQAEIAEVTRLHPGTVAQHVRRATRTLAVFMKATVSGAVLALLAFLTSGGAAWERIAPARRRDVTALLGHATEGILFDPTVVITLGISATALSWWLAEKWGRREGRYSKIWSEMESARELGSLSDLGRDPTRIEYAAVLGVSGR